MRTQRSWVFAISPALFLVKENRRQLGNSVCCISLLKISSTSRIFAMGPNEAKVGAMLKFESGDRIVHLGGSIVLAHAEISSNPRATNAAKHCWI